MTLEHWQVKADYARRAMDPRYVCGQGRRTSPSARVAGIVALGADRC